MFHSSEPQLHPQGGHNNTWKHPNMRFIKASGVPVILSPPPSDQSIPDPIIKELHVLQHSRKYHSTLNYCSTQVPPAPTVSSVDWSHLHCFNQILMFDCKHEGFSKLRPLLINVHIIMWGSSNRWIGDQVIDETRRQKLTLIFYCGENVAVYSLQTATAATALPPGRVWRDRRDVLWNTRGRNNHMIRRSSTLSHECRAELKDMSPFRLSIKLRFKLCQSDRCTNKVNSNPPSRLKLPTLTEKTNLLTWEQRRCSPTGR